MHRTIQTNGIPTAEYALLQKAFAFFNRKLFGGKLPNVMLAMHRHKGARGYFAPERFVGRGKDSVATHELALNPDTFAVRTDREICSTLVHEMCHLWQQEFGTAPRRCYHDREWAGQMKAVGLQPSTTGGPDGKETGQHVTHYIIDGGPYDLAFAELASKGWQLHWSDAWAAFKNGASAGTTAGTNGVGKAAAARATAAAKSAASKTKFSCPCGQNAWAKPTARLICGECNEEMEAAG